MNDPYINDVIEKFKNEYQKVFNNRPFLNSMVRNKIFEICSIEPGFKDNLSLLFEKYKHIEFNFKNNSLKPGLNWLILQDNWSDVLNGVYDNTDSDSKFWDKFKEE